MVSSLGGLSEISVQIKNKVHQAKGIFRCPFLLDWDIGDVCWAAVVCAAPNSNFQLCQITASLLSKMLLRNLQDSSTGPNWELQVDKSWPCTSGVCMWHCLELYIQLCWLQFSLRDVRWAALCFIQTAGIPFSICSCQSLFSCSIMWSFEGKVSTINRRKRTVSLVWLYS